MLTLIFTSFSLLLLPILRQTRYSWVTASVTLFILAALYSSLIFSFTGTPHSWSSRITTDSLSSPLIVLTLWITGLIIIASQSSLISKNKPINYIFLITLLNAILLYTFAANNLILFYILFEASLIPTLLIILGWGYQPERLQAGIYLMIYTITASLPLLIRLLYSFHSINHLSLFLIQENSLVPIIRTSLWWFITIAAFIVKMPLFTVHLWLPKAHVEAPVAGSMILAAILLKLGRYGLLRLAMLFVWINKTATPIFSRISIWGACITGLICIRQTDIKSLIAYSSVGHIGLLVAGTISNTVWGWASSITIILAHGLCSSALFSLANITYEFTKTRRIYISKGLLSLFPLTTLLWFIISAANMAAPPTINLLGEIILITRATFTSLYLIPSLLIISFIAAGYSLVLYTTSQHGWPPLFLSLGHLFNSRNAVTTSLHATPLLLLIAAPEVITLWTWFLSILYICLPSKKTK